MPKKETGSKYNCAGADPASAQTSIKELLMSFSVIIISQKFFHGNPPLDFLRG